MDWRESIPGLKVVKLSASLTFNEPKFSMEFAIFNRHGGHASAYRLTEGSLPFVRINWLGRALNNGKGFSKISKPTERNGAYVPFAIRFHVVVFR